jgi:hypothetical protein
MIRLQTFVLAMLLVMLTGVGTAWGYLFLGTKLVRGRVYDAQTGAALAQATITVGGVVVRSETSGQFVALPLNYRRVELRAEAPGYLPSIFSFDLPWWMRTGYIDLPLSSGGIQGNIVDSATAQPLSTATVTVDGQPLSANQDGTFRLEHFTPPARVTVQAPGYRPWQADLTRLPVTSSETPLTVEMVPRRLTGVVLAADTGEPLAGVQVTLGLESVVTAKDGTFALDKADSGQILALTPGSTYLPLQVSVADDETLTLTLQPRQLEIFAVNGFTGRPLSGATITLGQILTQTDEAGRAFFSRVTPGQPGLIQAAGFATTSFEYTGTLTRQIVLPPTTVSGVVRDGVTGQPVVGGAFILGGQVLPLDERGVYTLTTLTPGTSVMVKAPGYARAFLTLPGEGGPLQLKEVDALPCRLELPASGPPCFDLHLVPFDAKAIYVPFGLLSRPEAVYGLLDLVGRTELNAIVVDVKGDRGLLAWDSQVSLAGELAIDGERPGWLSLAELLAESRARGIYTVARLVVFKDNPLAFGRPDLAVTVADGTIWTDGEALGWANPFREEVWDYNVGLAREVAELGFDEINLDYVRFPSDGNIAAITYAEENTAETRTTAIRTFVARLAEALAPTGVFLSADVFGLTVWVEPTNDMNIGQRVIDIAPHVDYLAPMLYPSTFVPGNLGYDDPSAYPYEVIYRSLGRALERVPPTIRVRPWLQAYNYAFDEMALQQQAATDAAAAGWSWWNAGGVYDEAVFGQE